ncbi:hypothetical protein BOTCAL_0331g00070 [Botryotinia calthae]|uniref:Uncharacterized protein n=1 Tax=Botryotinia calthae TaxID=38488 RepID=A0A4Y8CT63_9HELO|nr:hypothetical protein BOTCAL_0331g00070 [Botryotinia calthae]
MSGDQHARAAVGGMVAALCENTNIYMNDIPVAWTELDIEIDFDEAELNSIALPQVNNELNTIAIPEFNSGLNASTISEVNIELNTMAISEVSSEPKYKRPRVE